MRVSYTYNILQSLIETIEKSVVGNGVILCVVDVVDVVVEVVEDVDAVLDAVDVTDLGDGNLWFTIEKVIAFWQ